MAQDYNFSMETYRKSLKKLMGKHHGPSLTGLKQGIEDMVKKGAFGELLTPKFEMIPLVGKDAYVFKQGGLEIELSIPEVCKKFENIHMNIVKDRAWCLGVWTILIQKGFQIPPNVEDEFKAIIYGK